jgi:hypothetical protein
MQENELEKQSSDGEKRLEIAKKNLNEMMKEIRPFIKKRGTRIEPTSDGWMTTSEQQQQMKNK